MHNFPPLRRVPNFASVPISSSDTVVVPLGYTSRVFFAWGDPTATGRGANENLGNNQLLAANTDSGEIRRFLTGPRGCEITGLTFTPDGKTAFLNIQHPGGASAESEGPRASNWPSKVEGVRPRSATIVITKDDGGFIGS